MKGMKSVVVLVPLTVSLVLGSVLVGCGGDDGPEVHPCNADPCQEIDLAISGSCSAFGSSGFQCVCEGDTNWDHASGACASNMAFVVTNDFSTGSYSTVNLGTGKATLDLPSTVGIIEADSVAVHHEGVIYIINRFGFDNVSVVDTFDLTKAARQFSTGNGTNPHDMVFATARKAYISLYGSNELLIVDPTATAGREITGTIDLSPYNDPSDTNGLVEASPMVIVEGILYVGLQRLDADWSVVRDSCLAVIDTATDSLVDVDPGTGEVIDPIFLTGRNPIYLRYDEVMDKILASEVGSYFDQTDGGIEVIDPFSMEAEGFLIDETEMGGDIGDFVVVNGTKGYVVSGGFASNSIAIFDVATGTKTGTVNVQSPYIASLALDGTNRLLVSDRTAQSPGVRIFDTTTDMEVTAAPIFTGLPPFMIVPY